MHPAVRDVHLRENASVKLLKKLVAILAVAFLSPPVSARVLPVTAAGPLDSQLPITLRTANDDGPGGSGHR